MSEHKTSTSACMSAIVLLLLAAGVSVSVQAQRSSIIATDVKEFLIELDEDNWTRMLRGEWMVEFFAPWCPACKSLAPTWENLAVAAAEYDVNVAKIDVTNSPSLSGRFFVTALPTIYHVKDGEFRQYRGSRDGDTLLNLVAKRQWERIEPISAWKKPNTIHMSVLSYFFKLSHTLKDINTMLQQEYGLPTWGSYALFAIGTIFVGAALGLMLVCIVDLLYPPKKTQRQSFAVTRDNSFDGVEDLANEELEDDAEPTVEKNIDDADEQETEENEAKNDNDDDETEVSEKKNAETLAESSNEGSTTNSETEESKSETVDATAAEDIAAKQNAKDANAKSSPGEVRKRKPRKAD